MRIDSGIVDDFAISPEAAQIFIENTSGTGTDKVGARRREVSLTIRVADDDEYESDDD